MDRRVTEYPAGIDRAIGNADIGHAFIVMSDGSIHITDSPAYHTALYYSNNDLRNHIDDGRFAPNGINLGNGSDIYWYDPEPDGQTKNEVDKALRDYYAQKTSAWSILPNDLDTTITTPINYRFIPLTRNELDSWKELDNRQRRSWYRRVQHLNDRALQLGVEGRINPKNLHALAYRYNGNCAYCGQSNAGSWDHVIPLGRGGTNTIDNLLPAHPSCNENLDRWDSTINPLLNNAGQPAGLKTPFLLPKDTPLEFRSTALSVSSSVIYFRGKIYASTSHPACLYKIMRQTGATKDEVLDEGKPGYTHSTFNGKAHWFDCTLREYLHGDLTDLRIVNTVPGATKLPPGISSTTQIIKDESFKDPLNFNWVYDPNTDRLVIGDGGNSIEYAFHAQMIYDHLREPGELKPDDREYGSMISGAVQTYGNETDAEIHHPYRSITGLPTKVLVDYPKILTAIESIINSSKESSWKLSAPYTVRYFDDYQPESGGYHKDSTDLPWYLDQDTNEIVVGTKGGTHTSLLYKTRPAWYMDKYDWLGKDMVGGRVYKDTGEIEPYYLSTHMDLDEYEDFQNQTDNAVAVLKREFQNRNEGEFENNKIAGIPPIDDGNAFPRFIYDSKTGQIYFSEDRGDRWHHFQLRWHHGLGPHIEDSGLYEGYVVPPGVPQFIGDRSWQDNDPQGIQIRDRVQQAINEHWGLNKTSSIVDVDMGLGDRMFRGGLPFIYHIPTDTVYLANKPSNHTALAYKLPEEIRNNFTRHESNDKIVPGVLDGRNVVYYLPPDKFTGANTGWLTLDKDYDAFTPELNAAHNALRERDDYRGIPDKTFTSNWNKESWSTWNETEPFIYDGPNHLLHLGRDSARSNTDWPTHPHMLYKQKIDAPFLPGWLNHNDQTFAFHSDAYGSGPETNLDLRDDALAHIQAQFPEYAEMPKVLDWSRPLYPELFEDLSPRTAGWKIAANVQIVPIGAGDKFFSSSGTLGYMRISGLKGFNAFIDSKLVGSIAYEIHHNEDPYNLGLTEERRGDSDFTYVQSIYVEEAYRNTNAFMDLINAFKQDVGNIPVYADYENKRLEDVVRRRTQGRWIIQSGVPNVNRTRETRWIYDPATDKLYTGNTHPEIIYDNLDKGMTRWKTYTDEDLQKWLGTFIYGYYSPDGNRPYVYSDIFHGHEDPNDPEVKRALELAQTINKTATEFTSITPSILGPKPSFFCFIYVDDPIDKLYCNGLSYHTGLVYENPEILQYQKDKIPTAWGQINLNWDDEPYITFQSDYLTEEQPRNKQNYKDKIVDKAIAAVHQWLAQNGYETKTSTIHERRWIYDPETDQLYIGDTHPEILYHEFSKDLHNLPLDKYTEWLDHFVYGYFYNDGPEIFSDSYRSKASPEVEERALAKANDWFIYNWRRSYYKQDQLKTSKWTIISNLVTIDMGDSPIEQGHEGPPFYYVPETDTLYIGNTGGYHTNLRYQLMKQGVDLPLSALKGWMEHGHPQWGKWDAWTPAEKERVSDLIYSSRPSHAELDERTESSWKLAAPEWDISNPLVIRPYLYDGNEFHVGNPHEYHTKWLYRLREEGQTELSDYLAKVKADTLNPLYDQGQVGTGGHFTTPYMKSYSLMGNAPTISPEVIQAGLAKAQKTSRWKISNVVGDPKTAEYFVYQNGTLYVDRTHHPEIIYKNNLNLNQPLTAGYIRLDQNKIVIASGNLLQDRNLLPETHAILAQIYPGFHVDDAIREEHGWGYMNGSKTSSEHVMYHLAPINKREQIMQQGLLPAKPDRWGPDASVNPTAVYLFPSIEQAEFRRNFIQYVAGLCDLWEVRVDHVEPDKGMANSFYSTEPIPPQDLTLLDTKIDQKRPISNREYIGHKIEKTIPQDWVFNQKKGASLSTPNIQLSDNYSSLPIDWLFTSDRARLVQSQSNLAVQNNHQSNSMYNELVAPSSSNKEVNSIAHHHIEQKLSEVSRISKIQNGSTKPSAYSLSLGELDNEVSSQWRLLEHPNTIHSNTNLLQDYSPWIYDGKQLYVDESNDQGHGGWLYRLRTIDPNLSEYLSAVYDEADSNPSFDIGYVERPYLYSYKKGRLIRPAWMQDPHITSPLEGKGYQASLSGDPANVCGEHLFALDSIYSFSDPRALDSIRNLSGEGLGNGYSLINFRGEDYSGWGHPQLAYEIANKLGISVDDVLDEGRPGWYEDDRPIWFPSTLREYISENHTSGWKLYADELAALLTKDSPSLNALSAEGFLGTTPAPLVDLDDRQVKQRWVYDMSTGQVYWGASDYSMDDNYSVRDDSGTPYHHTEIMYKNHLRMDNCVDGYLTNNGQIEFANKSRTRRIEPEILQQVIQAVRASMPYDDPDKLAFVQKSGWQFFGAEISQELSGRMRDRWDEHDEAVPFIWWDGKTFYDHPSSTHNDIIYKNPELRDAWEKYEYENEPGEWYTGRLFSDGEIVSWDETRGEIPDWVQDQIREAIPVKIASRDFSETEWQLKCPSSTHLALSGENEDSILESIQNGEINLYSTENKQFVYLDKNQPPFAEVKALEDKSKNTIYYWGVKDPDGRPTHAQISYEEEIPWNDNITTARIDDAGDNLNRYWPMDPTDVRKVYDLTKNNFMTAEEYQNSLDYQGWAFESARDLELRQRSLGIISAQLMKLVPIEVNNYLHRDIGKPFILDKDSQNLYLATNDCSHPDFMYRLMNERLPFDQSNCAMGYIIPEGAGWGNPGQLKFYEDWTTDELMAARQLLGSRTSSWKIADEEEVYEPFIYDGELHEGQNFEVDQGWVNHPTMLYQLNKKDPVKYDPDRPKAMGWIDHTNKQWQFGSIEEHHFEQLENEAQDIIAAKYPDYRYFNQAIPWLAFPGL